MKDAIAISLIFGQKDHIIGKRQEYAVNIGGQEPMAEQKVTIKDVAREAGVSISTVSNALNGVEVLRPETKRHILEVAERMNYVPNLNGRNLKSQFTKVIGLFLTSIKGTYYNVLVDSIYQECREYGYELNIFVSERCCTSQAG